mmetsp:Transcript_95907/g.233111  ORF Transcript_95907/g.233111 Transcript_95907/m.233111 type:complete len:204 (-) Transcript_95907:2099-2710(-)
MPFFLPGSSLDSSSSLVSSSSDATRGTRKPTQMSRERMRCSASASVKKSSRRWRSSGHMTTSSGSTPSVSWSHFFMSRIWPSTGSGGRYCVGTPPSYGYTVKMIWRVTLCGTGTEKDRNGSKVIDSFGHTSQCTSDRSWPPKMSSTSDRLRARWPSHASLATSPSGRPLPSTFSTYGFFFTRFRSSWSPSSRKFMSSCESCCW